MTVTRITAVPAVHVALFSAAVAKGSGIVCNQKVYPITLSAPQNDRWGVEVTADLTDGQEQVFKDAHRFVFRVRPWCKSNTAHERRGTNRIPGAVATKHQCLPKRSNLDWCEANEAPEMFKQIYDFTIYKHKDLGRYYVTGYAFTENYHKKNSDANIADIRKVLNTYGFEKWNRNEKAIDARSLRTYKRVVLQMQLRPAGPIPTRRRDGSRRTPQSIDNDIIIKDDRMKQLVDRCDWAVRTYYIECMKSRRTKFYWLLTWDEDAERFKSDPALKEGDFKQHLNELVAKKRAETAE